ncbi:hypothetical protein O6H91_18G004500 [Diphasiastrum complanatum]|uniref:Uncharacterized protein n=1 Tax=Diphasiastrum complanatum TaxID=34168 RepID=A0ACC2AXW3_DIPCM|nr:hypothetical protein O6H91_18G004500 [Diphasiastrum complanatum]
MVDPNQNMALQWLDDLEEEPFREGFPPGLQPVGGVLPPEDILEMLGPLPNQEDIVPVIPLPFMPDSPPYSQENLEPPDFFDIDLERPNWDLQTAHLYPSEIPREVIDLQAILEEDPLHFLQLCMDAPYDIFLADRPAHGGDDTDIRFITLDSL